MKVGVVGGGQLGRMLALAAAPLNIEVKFLDPADDAGAAVAAKGIKAHYDDLDASMELARWADVVTFEFENVPPATLLGMQEEADTWPPAQALETSRDRWLEKSMFQRLDIPVPPIAAVDSQQDLESAIETIGLPAVMKTRTMGYDGKGQKVLRQAEDLVGAFDEIGGVPAIVEGFVAFDHEISMIAVRSTSGQLAFYDPVNNHHDRGILQKSLPLMDHPLKTMACDYAQRVLEELNYSGTMAFEFFVCGDQLMANEIAPRVHNSGHWTIEGAACSQFDNHLRAICGLPLGSTETRGHVAMYNVIGRWPSRDKLLAIAGAHVHDYAKSSRSGRKIGHITVTAETAEALAERCLRLEQVLCNDY